MKKSQLAAQMYTLRNFTNTPDELVETFRKVKSIGYDSVQISGVKCNLPPEELYRIVSGEGLSICATHEPGADIFDRIDAVIARLNALHCKHTAYPWPHIRPTDTASALEIAEKLEHAAQTMRAAGLTLCYHNHAFEFERFDGKLFLDIIYDNAPTICGELDTFWVQSGGCSPAEWVAKLGKRGELLHLKDYTVKDNERRMAPIGGGNLDWVKIISAGEKAGVKYFIVEQDDCGAQCPFDALKQSYGYLMENFVK